MKGRLGRLVICVSFSVIASITTLLAGCGGGKSVMPSAAGLTQEPRPSAVLPAEAESVKLARAKGGNAKSSKGSGKINVTSTPSGGRIFLNGNDTSQVTPALLKNVPAGTTTVTVRKEGYEDCTQTVQLQARKTINVACQLTSAPPVIIVHSLSVSSPARFDCAHVFVIAEVTAISGVSSVKARIVRQLDGQSLPDVMLHRTGNPSLYQGSFTAPANTRSDGQSEVYAVIIAATDQGGRQTEKAAGTFEVPSPSPVPNPPTLSRRL